QEFEGRRFRYSCRLSGKLGIQAGDNVPSNIGDCLAAADRACKINFDGVDAGNMVHDRADRTAVGSHRTGYIPTWIGKFFSKTWQTGSSFLNTTSQQLSPATHYGLLDALDEPGSGIGRKEFLRISRSATLSRPQARRAGNPLR